MYSKMAKMEAEEAKQKKGSKLKLLKEICAEFPTEFVGWPNLKEKRSVKMLARKRKGRKSGPHSSRSFDANLKQVFLGVEEAFHLRSSLESSRRH